MDEHVLSSRQKLFLSYIDAKHTVVSGQELADQLAVSTRTIRQMVKELADVLDPSAIRVLSVPGRGYALEVNDRKLFHELISDQRHIRTREDRIAYLMRVLLESDHWIALADLEEQMYVSRTTLENDLREVRRRIVENEPYIGFTRRSSSLLFEQDERKRRDILIRMYLEKWDFNSREGLAFRNSILEADVLEGIRRALRDMLSGCAIELDDYGHIYMLLSTAILYERNLLGHPLTSFDGEGAEWAVRAVGSYLDALKTSWEIELQEADYRWLSSALTRLSVLRFTFDPAEVREEMDGGKGRKIYGKLCGDLRAQFGLDFSCDARFESEMLQCISSFLLRQLSAQIQSRFECEIMAKNYPHLEMAAVFIGKELSELSGYRIREEEALYLLPVLASAAERKQRARRERLRAVVVSHLGHGLTGYLRENLIKLFGNRIEVAGCVPVYDRSRIREYRPALIVTTVEAESFRSYDVPAVVTSPTITEADMLRLDACIQRLERELLKA